MPQKNGRKAKGGKEKVKVQPIEEEKAAMYSTPNKEGQKSERGQSYLYYVPYCLQGKQNVATSRLTSLLQSTLYCIIIMAVYAPSGCVRPIHIPCVQYYSYVYCHNNYFTIVQAEMFTLRHVML